MSGILSIATSGLQAATRRLEVSASTIANADSAGPMPPADPATVANNPSPSVPEHANTVETADGGSPAVLTAVSPSDIATSDPTARHADSKETVAVPTVDFATQAARRLQARDVFAANAQVIRTCSQVMKSLLDINI